MGNLEVSSCHRTKGELIWIRRSSSVNAQSRSTLADEPQEPQRRSCLYASSTLPFPAKMVPDFNTVWTRVCFYVMRNKLCRQIPMRSCPASRLFLSTIRYFLFFFFVGFTFFGFLWTMKNQYFSSLLHKIRWKKSWFDSHCCQEKRQTARIRFNIGTLQVDASPEYGRRQYGRCHHVKVLCGTLILSREKQCWRFFYSTIRYWKWESKHHETSIPSSEFSVSYLLSFFFSIRTSWLDKQKMRSRPMFL